MILTRLSKTVSSFLTLEHRQKFGRKNVTYIPGGGGLTLERGMGMCRGHDPLFQASRRSLAY